MDKNTQQRTSGLLLHITSLPNDYTLGTFSSECFKLIDWMHEAGFKIWQVLPLTDCGYKYSPYSAISSFALNPFLIDLTQFLTPDEMQSIDFDKSEEDRLVEEAKFLKALDMVYDKFGKTSDKSAFEKANKYWLDDYAVFKVIKQVYKNIKWTEFPIGLRNRNKVAMDTFKAKYSKEIDKIKFFQFIADEQWKNIKAYAKKNDIQIFGDIPFYVELDSSDVWSNPKNWKLETGSKGEVAGVPPDYFNKDGQLWGNPIYNYSTMAKDKYSFFVKRFKRQEDLCDIIKIDHFIAFCRYWSIPANATTAKKGKWIKGYGNEILKELKSKLKMKIVAEDLGIVTEDVTMLREKFGIPGLKVLQFAFDEEGDHIYQPHNYEKNCVAYIGTHDNDTFMGMLYNSDWDKINRYKRYIRIPLEWGNDAVIDNSIITMYRSSANMIILTMQDILKLNTEARMNIPGTIKGNWSWQLDCLPDTNLCKWYKELADIYGR